MDGRDPATGRPVDGLHAPTKTFPLAIVPILTCRPDPTDDLLRLVAGAKTVAWPTIMVGARHDRARAPIPGRGPGVGHVLSTPLTKEVHVAT